MSCSWCRAALLHIVTCLNLIGMHSGSLVDWLTLVVSAVNTVLLVVNACFVWQYVQETTKIRVVNEAQLEGQIRPAIVVLAELTESLPMIEASFDRMSLMVKDAQEELARLREERKHLS